jgi:hypothetical protein
MVRLTAMPVVAAGRRFMFRYWRHLFLLSTESYCVVMLRTIKLAKGGSSALDEAWRILVEKTTATTEIPERLLDAKSPLGLAVDYRKMVRSNRRRLLATGDPAGEATSL